jgi:hypothetical protein
MGWTEGEGQHEPVWVAAPAGDEPAHVVTQCSCGATPGADEWGTAWLASHLESLGAPDYMVVYWRTWAGYVEAPNAALSRDQVARELSDYEVVMGEASKVYEDLAGFSKPNTAAHHVIAAAEEKFAATYADLILCDLLDVIEGDENRQAVIDYANELHAGAYAEHLAAKAANANVLARHAAEPVAIDATPEGIKLTTT